MIVDAHVHIADGDSERYPFGPPTGASRPWWRTGRYDVESLLRAMDATGVDHAVVVQSVGAYRYDNRYLLDAVSRHVDRLRAVVALDLGSHDPGAELSSLARGVGVAGVRLVVVETDGSWTSDGRGDELFAAAAEADVVLSLTARSSQLPLLMPLLDAHPQVPVVLEHCALPTMAEGVVATDDPLLALCDSRQVSLKVSTHNLRQAGDHIPELMSQLGDTFGARRLLWASDHPQSVDDYPTALRFASRAEDAAGAAWAGGFLGSNAHHSFFR